MKWSSKLEVLKDWHCWVVSVAFAVPIVIIKFLNYLKQKEAFWFFLSWESTFYHLIFCHNFELSFLIKFGLYLKKSILKRLILARTFSKTTLSRLTFSRMTLTKITSSKMTLTRMTFTKMTQQNDVHQNNVNKNDAEEWLSAEWR